LARGIDRCLPAVEKEAVEMNYTEIHDAIDVVGLLTSKQEAA
jgi:hypothetical protein